MRFGSTTLHCKMMLTGPHYTRSLHHSPPVYSVPHPPSEPRPKRTCNSRTIDINWINDLLDQNAAVIRRVVRPRNEDQVPRQVFFAVLQLTSRMSQTGRLGTQETKVPTRLPVTQFTLNTEPLPRSATTHAKDRMRFRQMDATREACVVTTYRPFGPVETSHRLPPFHLEA